MSPRPGSTIRPPASARRLFDSGENSNGEPLKDKRCNRFEMMLQDGVGPELLAGILTKRIRCDLFGGDNKFSRPLEFADETFV
jgi:hypothetical protein